MTKEELVNKFVENAHAIKEIETKQKGIKENLRELCGHKVGEIIEWTERGRKKNIGNLLRPKFEPLPDKEHKAVLIRVTPNIHIWSTMCDNEEHVDFFYSYEFHEITKSGSISQRQVYVRDELYEWTGKIHKDYQKKLSYEDK